MRRHNALAVFFAAVLVLAAAARPARAGGPKVTGDRLLFSVTDLEGHAVTSDDPRFEGKVVLVDIWGTWCPPCRTEIPTFIDLQERYGPRGLVIVAMAFERESDPEARRARLREFVLDRSINYLVLDGGNLEDFASTLPVLEKFKGFPAEIYIDPQGKVVDTRYGYGYSKGWAKKLDRKLARMLEKLNQEPAGP